MASPAIVTTGTTNGTTASATPALNLPSGIQQNDLLLGFFRVAVAGAIGWPTGWTELVDASPDGADDQLSIAWKRAEGTESGTISLTCTSGKFAGIIYRISGAADPHVRAPETSTVATGTSPTEPNATTVTPTGGSKDYLFVTWYSMEGEQTGITAYPANYTHGQSGFVNSGTGGAVTSNVTMAAAGRQLTASSEDAGAWDVTGTLDDWSAYTVAVHPPDASPDLAWQQRVDTARVVLAKAAPIVAISMVFASAIPEDPRNAVWGTTPPQPVRRIPPAQEAPPPPPWSNLPGPTGEQAPQNVGGALFGAQTIHTLQGAGPVSSGTDTRWLSPPPQPAGRVVQIAGVAVWIPFVEETPYAWHQPPPLQPVVRARPEPPGLGVRPSTDTAGFNQELAWTARGGEPPPPARQPAPGPFVAQARPPDPLVDEFAWRPLILDPVRRIPPAQGPFGRQPVISTEGALTPWPSPPGPVRAVPSVRLQGWSPFQVDAIDQYAWRVRPPDPIRRTPLAGGPFWASKPTEVSGANQLLSYVREPDEVIRRARTVARGIWYGDPTSAATLPVADIDGITQGGMPGALWGRSVIHYQQAAGPVRVINVNVPEIAWWPRMPGIIRRTPQTRHFQAFPLRPPGDPLTNGPYSASDDGVIRPVGTFGYQAWAGPIATTDPSFRSDLPWIARLDPPIRRRALTQVVVARPIQPPETVPHPLWQSQAATFLGIRRTAPAGLAPLPGPFSFESTFTQLAWLPPLHRILRRRPDPWVVTAEGPFPQSDAGGSDLPWLPPPLTFRRIPAPWAPTPIQPWDPPPTVFELAWAPPLHEIIRRRPDPLWGFALSPFPQGTDNRSDLPWLPPPVVVRPPVQLPRIQDALVLRPPDIPTYVAQYPEGPIRRRLQLALGPSIVLPPVPDTGLLWWPAPPVLEPPMAREAPPLWNPAWSLLIVGDQWCIQLSYEMGRTPALIEEIGIPAALINEIGLTARAADEEEC